MIHESVATLLFLTYVALQLGDIWTTNKVLSQGGTENNPIMAKLQEATGKLWAPIKFIGAAALGYVAWQAAPIALVPMVLFYAWIVYNNYKQIK